MDMTPIGQIKYWMELAHKELISLVSGLSDEKIAWQPHPDATSIAFNVWHLARWADYVQSNLRQNTAILRQRLTPYDEIWISERLANAWGLTETNLGMADAGTDMDDRAAELRFPGCAVLFDYLRRCYALEDEALAAVDEEQFEALRDRYEQKPLETVGRWLMNHLIHDWEHLGMIRYVSGLYDLQFAKD